MALRQSLLLKQLLHAKDYVLLRQLSLVKVWDAPNLAQKCLEFGLGNRHSLNFIKPLNFDQLLVKLGNVGRLRRHVMIMGLQRHIRRSMVMAEPAWLVVVVIGGREGRDRVSIVGYCTRGRRAVVATTLERV